MKLNVVFRVDASSTVGMGHLSRCLNLATYLDKNKSNILFILKNSQTRIIKNLINYYQFKYKFISSKVDNYKDDSSLTCEIVKNLFSDKVDWLIVDNYDLDFKWEKICYSVSKKILVIDDCANRKHFCDALLDQNYFKNYKIRYENLVPKKTKLFLGPKYLLFAKNFFEYKKKVKIRSGEVKKILVFFGGGSQNIIINKTLHSLKKLRNKYKFRVELIVGNLDYNSKEINKFCVNNKWCVYNFNIKNMSEKIISCDLAIGAGGFSMWERCYLGLPSITFIIAKNQLKPTIDAAKKNLIFLFNYSMQNKFDETKMLKYFEECIENKKQIKNISRNSLSFLNKLNYTKLIEFILQKKTSLL